MARGLLLSLGVRGRAIDGNDSACQQLAQIRQEMDGSPSESGFCGENDGIIFRFYIFRHTHSYTQVSERYFNVVLSFVTSRGGG